MLHNAEQRNPQSVTWAVSCTLQLWATLSSLVRAMHLQPAHNSKWARSRGLCHSSRATRSSAALQESHPRNHRSQKLQLNLRRPWAWSLPTFPLSASETSELPLWLGNNPVKTVFSYLVWKFFVSLSPLDTLDHKYVPFECKCMD